MDTVPMCNIHVSLRAAGSSNLFEHSSMFAGKMQL